MQGDLQKKRYKPGKLEIYGLWGSIRLVLLVVRTKMLIPSARIINIHFDVRGKKHIQFGKRITIGKNCRIEAYPYLNQGTIITFGNDIEINDYVHITGIKKVEIGNNVLIASKVYISDSNHGSYSGNDEDSNPESIPGERPMYSRPVKIEDNVWIGESVTILSGVSIGKGSIIGANSLVNKDIPSYTIVAGIPAKPIKMYNHKTNHWEKI